jgi:tRNA modification GTPase
MGDPTDVPGQPNSIIVHPKSDVMPRPHGSGDLLAVSAVTGEGIKELLDRINEIARHLLPSEDAISLNRRQADLLADAAAAISRIGESGDLVIAAEQLRAARAAFDRLTGRAGIDDVLDALFSRFCLGK